MSASTSVSSLQMSWCRMHSFENESGTRFLFFSIFFFKCLLNNSKHDVTSLVRIVMWAMRTIQIVAPYSTRIMFIIRDHGVSFKGYTASSSGTTCICSPYPAVSIVEHTILMTDHRRACLFSETSGTTIPSSWKHGTTRSTHCFSAFS